MSMKVDNTKMSVFNFHLAETRINYPYLTMKEAITLASLETTFDGYPGPIIGSDEDIQWVLTKVKIREMPASAGVSSNETLPEEIQRVLKEFVFHLK